MARAKKPQLGDVETQIFARVRLAVKDAIVWLGFGDRLVEYCEDCGVRQPLVWWSPNDLWSELTGYTPTSGDNMPGTICPACFDRRASRRGLVLRWTPTVAHRLSADPVPMNRER